MTQAGKLLGMGRTGVWQAIRRGRLAALVSEEMEGTSPGILISERAIEAYRESRKPTGSGPGRGPRRRDDLNEGRGRRLVATAPAI
jgi:hypothetical protein